ncbi:hypothetical protein Ct61P_12306 [Colletotrichum tofieldiae]|nr:hypothetical protein Ct61P_12306 [Colletotrichum tofieldiae]
MVLTAEANKLAENLARTPNEIVEAIFDNTDDYMGRDLPRLSSRLISQKLWKEPLKAMPKTPNRAGRAGRAGFEWDWKLLIRQLSRGVDYGLRPGCPKDTSPSPALADRTKT